MVLRCLLSVISHLSEFRLKPGPTHAFDISHPDLRNSTHTLFLPVKTTFIVAVPSLQSVVSYRSVCFLCQTDLL